LERDKKDIRWWVEQLRCRGFLEILHNHGTPANTKDDPRVRTSPALHNKAS
jgi:hypothetical protein